MNTCAVQDCAVQLAPGKVFCQRHWIALPRNCRDLIYAGMRRPERMQAAIKTARIYLACGRALGETAEG